MLRADRRQRADLIAQRAAPSPHRPKALTPMHRPLTQGRKAIPAVTGLQISRAIVNGERNPLTLAQVRQPTGQHRTDAIAQALTGHDRAEHRFALQQALSLSDSYTAQIQECDQALERPFSARKPTHADARPPLDTCDQRDPHRKRGPPSAARTLRYQWLGVDLVARDGLNASRVQALLAEGGTRMEAFPTVKHFCAGLH